MTTEEFSKLIKDKRIKLNLTQKELGDKLGVSNKTISRWESSHGYPDIETIPKLARILELSYEELLDGNEYIAKKEKHKNKRNLIIILMMVCLTIVIGYQWHQTNKDFESQYSNKDLLVSGDMLNKISFDYQEAKEGYQIVTPLGVLNSDKSELLLKRIKVDHLIEVPKDIQQINYDNFQWVTTMHFNYHKQVVLKLHVYYCNQKTYFLFNQNPNYRQLDDGDLYYYNELIPIGLEMFADDLDDYDFDHQLKIKGDYLLPVDKEKQILLFKNIFVETSQTFNDKVIVINENGNQYLVLIGENIDFDEIKVINQDNTFKIDINGKETLLANKCVHIFEIVKPVNDFALTINGEIDHVYLINNS